MPFKTHLKEYLERQAMLCARAGVEIRLNTTVTPEYAVAQKADVLIAALGARPVKPPVEGIDGTNVYAAEEVYLDAAKAGKKVVILGAGLVGVEMAIFLAQQGREAALVEILDRPNLENAAMHAMAVMKELRERKIPMHLNTRATKIRPDSVEIEGREGKGFLEADTVIYAAGMRAQRDDAIALSQCAPEFVMLGDCQTPKNIIAATQTAHTAAMLIGTK